MSDISSCDENRLRFAEEVTKGLCLGQKTGS